MVDRLELAKQYVQEMLEQRDDIVGAYVGGSVARGDATEASDIDLALVVDGLPDEEIQRGGIDTWRDGVYVEAGLAPVEWYADVEKVLLNPVTATHMNDALILYDPKGLLSRLQQAVRAVYMEPRWLGVRVQARLHDLRESMSGLKEAVVSADVLSICWFRGWVALHLPSIPLLVWAITPSSTRSLTQLLDVSPGLRQRICEWEGSSGMGLEEVRALLPTTSLCLDLIEAASPSRWGHAYGYILRKAEWFVAEGLHWEALHVMGFVPGGMADTARKSEDPATISRARDLAQTWLQAVGWEGKGVLEEKVRTAEEMVAEVEAVPFGRSPNGQADAIASAMAAHLPLSQDGVTE